MAGMIRFESGADTSAAVRTRLKRARPAIVIP